LGTSVGFPPFPRGRLGSQFALGPGFSPESGLGASHGWLMNACVSGTCRANQGSLRMSPGTALKHTVLQASMPDGASTYLQVLWPPQGSTLTLPPRWGRLSMGI
jgi:hypothetical protein